MVNGNEIRFSNFKDIEKFIDDVIKENLKSKNKTKNDFENENEQQSPFEALPENLKEAFNEAFVKDDFAVYLKALKEHNKNRPRILNPEAVQKAGIIKKAISEIKNEIEYNNDCEIKIKEELSSGFRWDYILKMKAPLIEFTQILDNPVFTLFKIAVLCSDTMEFPVNKDIENEFEIDFNVYNIYKNL
jgi:hypothetical protein